MPDKALKGHTIKVPDKCVEKIKMSVQNFNGPKTTKGYERAINIIKNPFISMELLKKINNFFRNEEEGTAPYELTGGDYGKKIFNALEKQLRNSKSVGKEIRDESGMDDESPTNVTVPDVDVKSEDLMESIKRINKLINY
jgi:hypothetical protein